VKRFKSAKRALGDLDADSAALLVAAAADVTLILDAKGIVRDIACGNDELASELVDAPQWVGLAWGTTVTAESRPKVAAMLEEAAGGTATRWRQLNHPTARGPDIPILYCVAPAGRAGRYVAFGRDLRTVASLQQRLLDAQQSLERDYARLRHAETRYRLLFQIASEGVLIVDGTTLRILEANATAEEVLGESARGLVGKPLLPAFDARASESLQTMLATARTAGRAEQVPASLAGGRAHVLVSAFLFRQENTSLFLVRLAPAAESGAIVPRVGARSKLLQFVDTAQDGIVVTDADGIVLAANRGFLELVQLVAEDQAQGKSLDRWLGRPGVDMGVLMANLRQHGSLRLFATSVRGEYGVTADVEISAVAMPNGERPCYGFTIRNVGQRVVPDARGLRELPHSVSQMTELVGRVALKDLVREATDVIERLCIEAALELTADNRASAAEMLGLSRQSLYVKLRRYGLGDLAPEDVSK
jgi:transcriptional regulator PpsR